MARAAPEHDRLESIAASTLRLSRAIRYVAIVAGADLAIREAAGHEHASARETDYFEERLVNPTILELGRRRGAEGCGGFDFIVVGYGHFHQLVIPAAGGHVSVAIEPNGAPMRLVPLVRGATSALGTEPAFDRPTEPAVKLTDAPVFLADRLSEHDQALVGSLYAVTAGVRYVALNRDGRLVLSTRVSGDEAQPGDRSDRYEELIVNPTLLAITRARGDIDCGGLRFLVVAYPSFFALVLPLPDGHATVSLPRDADAVALAPAFERALAVSRGAGA